ncbi:uncharacterized protein LOC141941666 [Strix uralensis]|uniref:uncharacterized protein LOC141941666 n=1 Tax=Strix uralensis TaxID=36305 RepID=UPI003DA714DF
MYSPRPAPPRPTRGPAGWGGRVSQPGQRAVPWGCCQRHTALITVRERSAVAPTALARAPSGRPCRFAASLFRSPLLATHAGLRRTRCYPCIDSLLDSLVRRGERRCRLGNTPVSAPVLAAGDPKSQPHGRFTGILPKKDSARACSRHPSEPAPWHGNRSPSPDPRMELRTRKFTNWGPPSEPVPLCMQLGDPAAPGAQGSPHAVPVHRGPPPFPLVPSPWSLAWDRALPHTLVRGNLGLPAPVHKTGNLLGSQNCPVACSLLCQLLLELLGPLLAFVGHLSFPSEAWKPCVTGVPTPALCCAPASPLHHWCIICAHPSSTA